jgi:integrase/recombinase XerD
MKTLRKALDRYLAFRRSLGYKLITHGRALPHFIAFLHARGAEFITTELALAWAQQPEQVTQAYHASRLSIVRDFARYLSATDPRNQVPPQGLLLAQPQRAQPYIYTDEEIVGLIRQASRLQTPGALRPSTYGMLFGLLAVTGMRVGEALALDRADVDLRHSVLTVRKGKFNKTRIIPVHDSTRDRLGAYARRRDRFIPAPSADSFFLSDRGTRMLYNSVLCTFINCACVVGLRQSAAIRGPRLHDLRHTFAVKTLTTWYRSGINPERRLPLLSAYLGHVKVSNTYWYLSAVPELLGAVSARLDNLFGDRS